MADVETLFQDFAAAFERDRSTDPRPYLEQVEGVDRRELEVRIEAYVGRRIEGRAVEVTFVSAWGRLPEDRDLEAPFWSDIALRYDQFEVDVFEAVPLASR